MLAKTYALTPLLNLKSENRRALYRLMYDKGIRPEYRTRLEAERALSLVPADYRAVIEVSELEGAGILL